MKSVGREGHRPPQPFQANDPPPANKAGNPNSFKDSDEEANELVARRGESKLNSKKSKFAKPEMQKAPFDERATGAMSEIQARQAESAELVKQFAAIMKDSTLDRNRGPIEKNLEAENYRGLLAMAKHLNNDINVKEESAGSIALISLLMKMGYHFRDTINELNYKVNLLTKEIASLKKEIADLSSSKPQ